MPGLAARFPTVHDYAGATIPELYDEAWLASAVRLEATVLESGVWLNGGAEGFVFHPFPVEGQAGEVRGMIGPDLDGDGDLDLILEDGLGTVLLADGNGGFAAERWGVRGVAPGLRERAMWDLNGDGLVDLVGVSASGDVAWQKGEEGPPAVAEEAAAKRQSRGDG
jgi:hypothetical protein